MAQMTPRERVLKALRHQEPDRVPLDSAGCSATTIAAEPYAKLKRLLGITGGPFIVYDVLQQLACPEQWYLDRFEVDVIDATREFSLDTSQWQDWEISDGSIAKIPPWIRNLEREDGGWVFRAADGTILGRMPAARHFFDQVHWPLADAGVEEYDHPERYMPDMLWAAMARHPGPLARDPAYPDLLRKATKKLYETTDYAVMLNTGLSIFETAQFLRRTDNVLMDLLTDRKNLERLLDRILEMNLAALDRLLTASGPYIHIVKVNDDWGMQEGLLISRELFRRVFKPRHRIMYDFIKQKQPGVFIFLHSCGSIYEVLGDLIDIGLDIINPVQTSAANMEPERLKREFSRHLTFWGGGVDTQRVLPFGTPEEVEADVARKMRAFAPGGGFVFTQSHNIAPGVPPQNVLAMFEAFEKHRDYPVR
ncbi:MAG: methyltransferase [Gemmatimonadetes bacterium]|nr:methyltransferase [Gemmatimonadota bacterium]